MAGETILIVDDAQQNHHFLNDYVLVPNGYKPQSARDGVEGLQMALRMRPDLILLDLNMPRKDGREALREIKSSAELRRIPIVVLTTSKADEDVIRTYDLGVNSFITKPVTFEGLVDVLSTLGKYWFEIVELPPEEAPAK